jgi:hypothetical protein
MPQRFRTAQIKAAFSGAEIPQHSEHVIVANMKRSPQGANLKASPDRRVLVGAANSGNVQSRTLSHRTHEGFIDVARG